jgi:hypothetical protein
MIFDSVVSRTSSRSICTLVSPTHVIPWLPGVLLSLLILGAPAAHAQTADDQAITAQQDTPVLITLTGSDPENDPLTFAIATGPTDGTLSNHLDGDALVTYTPDPGFSGSDSFTFTVSDGGLPSAEATVSITVNGRPTADDQGVSTDEDIAVLITLSGSDPEGDPLTFEIESDPSNGSLSGTPPTVTYTPNAHYNGPDSFTFTVSDGVLTSAAGTVTIGVASVNDAPVVTIQQPTTGSSFDFGTTISFSASATDVEDNNVALTNSIDWTSNLVTGSLGKGGNLNLATLPVGTHQITAAVTDADEAPGSATITIGILNTAPTAIGQSVSTGEDTPLPITLTGSDPEGSPLTFAIATGPADGALSGTPPNVIYTPDADFNGGDSFTFTVSDGELTSLPAAVSITVNAGNDAPVANAQSVTTAEDTPLPIVLTGSDPEGSALTYSIQTQPINGTLTGVAPNVTYTPDADFDGSDSFTFTVNDSELDSLPATIDISVTPVNDPPTAVDDNDSTPEDTPVTTSVLANDTDIDDAPGALSVTPQSATATASGNGSFSCSASDCTYTPNLDFNGVDSYSYEVCDDEVPTPGCDTATVSISVTAGNDAPVAVDDSESTLEDTPVTTPVLANDTDIDDAPGALSVTPQSATATASGNGSFSCSASDCTYAPNLDFNGVDSYSYEVCDDEVPTPGCDTATVTVTINPVNDAPTFVRVVPPGLITPEDTTLTILASSLEINDPDTDPSNFVLTLDTPLPDANYTLAGPASITPAENFNGELSVRATVNDGELGTAPFQLDSAPFVIPVTVTAENDLPALEAEIGPQTAIENSLFELNVFGNFSDADGDTLTFSATGLPVSNSITIDPVTGLISGTPTEDDARDNAPYVVVVTATDPEGASVSDEFDLTVSALDRANIGLSIGVTPESGLPNDQLTWTFTASNPIGPAPGQNVELTGSFFGDGLSVAAGGGASCSITLETGKADFVCTIGALPVGGTASINFTTTASQATEVVAFGTAAGAQPVPIDPNISDNSAVRALGVAESFSDGAVQFLGDATIRSMAAGDFNGDGKTDLVVGTAAGQPVQVYLGDEPRESCGCQRDFVATPISIPDTGSNEGIAVADFDNDGNLDFVVANSGGQPDAIYRNDGTGNFALAALLAPSNGRDVAVGDFNNDGNMDIAIAATSPNPVYFGDGAGGFGAGILLGDAESFDVAVGRFDDDLFDDLVFANVGSDSQVWLNNGGTGFAAGAALQIGDSTSVAAADLNADNLDDLVFGRVPGGDSDVPANPVLLNQGGSGFGGPFAELGISPTNEVLIGDVSDDGVPDIVFINASGLHQTWVADGAAYTLHGEQIIDIDARVGVLADLGFADTDDPGGIDLALGGALDAGAAVYLNDSAGNLGLGDAVAPVLTLTGQATVSIPAGSAYTDSGATATDNIDGDVTARILVDNPVNTGVVGAYTVTYNVQDLAGNAAVSVTRTVSVTAATGRGGGGGGSLGLWMPVSLIIVNLLFAFGSRIREKRA